MYAMNQPIYQIIAFLLRYPEQNMHDMLPELEEELEVFHQPEIKSNLKKFLYEISSSSIDKWIEHYIRHFDFGRTTNLYVTYLKLGEQRERGLELLKLKKFFEAHGFEVTNRELPDYLPLILEFCANVPKETSNQLLAMHQEAIREIRDRLAEEQSYYQYLFDALLIYMKNNGVEDHLKQAVMDY